jgi:tetratricopeptide (TPR) repeat protein
VIRVNLRPVRIVVAILAVAICLFIIQASARIGFSRLLSRYALLANSIPAANEAIRLSPSDPETHRARATIFNRLRMPAETVKSLESALSLRYRDDYLWLELGNAREELNDTQGALAAFDQAVRWAPHYAHTHWQRGNLLLRLGRTAEAFAELRTATEANRSYLPNLIDLAWGISRGDVNATLELIDLRHDQNRVDADTERLTLIRFLAKKGKGREVIDQARLLSRPLSEDQKNELVRLLFAAKAFRDSFELSFEPAKLREPSLFNGSFEEPFVFNNAGFGWLLSPEQSKSKLAIDVSEKFVGTKSLQITLDGHWDPGTPLISQTVLVEPGKTYALSFAVRTRDLATGGPPVITVSDAATNQLLGKSDIFPSGTTSWVTMNFEFATLATSEAAVIRLQRNNCEPAPCPIFGVLWLDAVEIVQLQRAGK